MTYKHVLKTLLRPALFGLAGVVCGCIYYATIGCVTGSCAIRSNLVASVLFGGSLGVLLSVVFSKGGR